MEINSKIRKPHIRDVILNWILAILKQTCMKSLAAITASTSQEVLAAKGLIADITTAYQL
jgi:hypothetical protein